MKSATNFYVMGEGGEIFWGGGGACIGQYMHQHTEKSTFDVRQKKLTFPARASWHCVYIHVHVLQESDAEMARSPLILRQRARNLVQLESSHEICGRNCSLTSLVLWTTKIVQLKSVSSFCAYTQNFASQTPSRIDACHPGLYSSDAHLSSFRIWWRALLLSPRISRCIAIHFFIAHG